MKKYLFILLLYLSDYAQAQIPDYFANDPTWHCEYLESNEPFQWWDINFIEDFVYYINGDTTIGAHTYHWIHKRGTFTDYPGGATYNIDYPTDYFFRQEGRTLRYYHHGSGTDSLCLDYNMEIGDSIGFQYSGGSSMHDTVTAIDSVLIGSAYRRIFSVGSTTFVEGIGYYWLNGGSYSGEMFKYPSANPNFSTDYRCYGQNHQALWDPEHENNPVCYVNVGIEEKDAVAFQIFPNPAYNLVNLNFSETLTGSILEIRDLQGILQFRTTILHTSEAINIKFLSQGTYIITVSKDDLFLCKKLLVQH